MITPASISVFDNAAASARHSVMWPPRHPGSRGEPSVTPCGASHASDRATAISVSATAFARIRSIPAAATRRIPSATPASPTIGGGAPDPRLDRLPQAVLVLAGHVAEGRGARSAAQELVGAAHGEVRAGLVQG